MKATLICFSAQPPAQEKDERMPKEQRVGQRWRGEGEKQMWAETLKGTACPLLHISLAGGTHHKGKATIIPSHTKEMLHYSSGNTSHCRGHLHCTAPQMGHM